MVSNSVIICNDGDGVIIIGSSRGRVRGRGSHSGRDGVGRRAGSGGGRRGDDDDDDDDDGDVGRDCRIGVGRRVGSGGGRRGDDNGDCIFGWFLCLWHLCQSSITLFRQGNPFFVAARHR